MKQAQILSLLTEFTNANPPRKNEIHCLLADAVPKDSGGEKAAREDIHHETLETLLGKILVETPKYKLLSAAPTIVMICGDRDKHFWLANVDWEKLPA